MLGFASEAGDGGGGQDVLGRACGGFPGNLNGIPEQMQTQRGKTAGTPPCESKPNSKFL